MTIPRALDRLRVVIGHTFTDEATVIRKAQVADTSGGFTDSYTAYATYPCSFAIYPVRPREVESAQRIQLITQWAFVFPSTASILATDRLVVGTRTFEVVAANIGSIDVMLRVMCTEIL